MKKNINKCYGVYKIKKDLQGKIIQDNNIGVFDDLQHVADFLSIKKSNLKTYISKKVLINNMYEVIKIKL